MTAYITSADTVRPLGDGGYTTTLPVGVYAVTKDGNGYYLTKREAFSVPQKIYGNAEAISNRIGDRFQRIDGSMGALLSGIKGSGKTMAAKKIALDLNIPVILVETPCNEPAFISMLSSIDETCMVLFDEFDKVYSNQSDQNLILSMLDGTSGGKGKKLYVITVNDPEIVSSYMLNRPSRLFYAIEYDSLTNEDINSYCADNGVDENRIAEIQRFTNLFTDFNFDMMAALVEETIHYPDVPLRELVKFMNVKPVTMSPVYDVKMTIGGETIDLGWRSSVRNFLSKGYQIDLKDACTSNVRNKEEPLKWDVSLNIGPSDCVANSSLEEFIYREGAAGEPELVVTFTKQQKYTSDYYTSI